jgi:hypothetical protein
LEKYGTTRQVYSVDGENHWPSHSYSAEESESIIEKWEDWEYITPELKQGFCRIQDQGNYAEIHVSDDDAVIRFCSEFVKSLKKNPKIAE